MWIKNGNDYGFLVKASDINPQITALQLIFYAKHQHVINLLIIASPVFKFFA